MFCGIPCTVNIMVISDPITLIHLPCRTAQTMFILPKMGFGGRMQGGSWTRRLVNLKTFRMATYWWSRVTISKFSMVPEKLLYLPNRKVVFKPPFFRGELLKFGGGVVDGGKPNVAPEAWIHQGTWMRVDRSNADDLSKQCPGKHMMFSGICVGIWCVICFEYLRIQVCPKSPGFPGSIPSLWRVQLYIQSSSYWCNTYLFNCIYT